MTIKQRLAAMVGEIGNKDITRSDVMYYAIRYKIPFKMACEHLEAVRLIPTGTYADMMARCGTVRKIREATYRIHGDIEVVEE